MLLEARLNVSGEKRRFASRDLSELIDGLEQAKAVLAYEGTAVRRLAIVRSLLSIFSSSRAVAI